MPDSLNNWSAGDAGDVLSARYLAHMGTMRGAIRLTLVQRQLVRHLPPAPARILDVGGGNGHRAIELARAGHDVTVVDPAAAMLDQARELLADETPGTQARVHLIEGPGEQLAVLCPGANFDVAICHGVLLYVDDPRPLLAAICATIRPRGILSLVVKNAIALPVRPALQGRYEEALRLLRTQSRVEIGTLGVTTRADTVEDLAQMMENYDLRLRTWYGIRVFTDHLGDVAPGEFLPAAIDLEEVASERDPYRQFGRLIHAVFTRPGPDTDAPGG
jgi:ubiquinone/menaquinone biosynthesis C-methylase UbiE